MKKNRLSQHRDQTISVVWGGDVNIGRRFHYHFNENGADQALTAITPLMKADLTIVNLECVVATCGEFAIDKRERSSYYYRARPEMLSTLTNGGVDLVVTANNHSGDYGAAALLEQAYWLEQAGIGHAGSGATIEQAFKPVFRTVNDVTIAVFSIDSTQSSFAATHERPGHAFLDLAQPKQWHDTLKPLIDQARKQAHIVLVAVHWGANNEAAPKNNQILAGHAIIDAGADAILGASAHMLQGIEIYQGRPIIHDAGDLLFDAITRGDHNTGVFTLYITRSGVQQIRFTPFEVGFCQTLPLDTAVACLATHNFINKCEALGSKMRMTREGEGILDLSPPDRDNDIVLLADTVPYKQKKSAEVLAPISEPQPDWIADNVPEDAKLPEPVTLGPLELLGVRLAPNVLDKRGLLYIESWWRLKKKTLNDWRLDFRAGPTQESTIGRWGGSCDHDPCDWMWPTSRWTEGVIYHDSYTLRPPTVRHWEDADLQLTVGLVCASGKTKRVRLRPKVAFSLNDREAFAVMAANVPQYKIPQPDKIPPTPQILWDARQIEQITGGKWLTSPPPYWYISSISNKSNMIFYKDMPAPRMFVATDKKNLASHELYADLSGEDWNSHDDLIKLQNRLAGGLVSQPLPELKADFPVLQVKDPIHAFIQLGVAARQRLRGHLVAITGSAGKTTLSAMLTHAMSCDQRVRSNANINYNSRVGLMYLLANTPEHTDIVVMESSVQAINAPKFQNIKLARPDMAIITNIAATHLPKGRELDYIAHRKANIFEAVPEDGWAIIYRETACFDYICERARKRGLNILTYGESADADMRLLEHDPASGTVRVSLLGNNVIEYHLAAEGRHMALNSLACLTVRHILEQKIPPFLKALSTFAPVAGRGKLFETTFDGKKVTVIDESYNANPLSMRFALSLMTEKSHAGRRILILGDMLELGDKARMYHEELAVEVAAIKPDCVLACGPLMRFFWQSLEKITDKPLKGQWYENAAQICENIGQWIQYDDRIFVKGSNSVKLSNVVKVLTGSLSTGMEQ